ncbi:MULTISPECIES: hypothetical protein [unclassified Mesorhizobium]|uniref:hypothetical protein n=1 Tax=unclassified Mesorhizobium TaxID=325217 RepID=UPI00112A67FC|nr:MULTISPECIES: hypothetical protein [unclassified Mesorhizobium]MBZ9739734.1 hypothetical protein [Mesorhizobium sp. CO1-1-4]MBZ9805002.1 hypothetical protein [Mesorhizobium sp. ES1-6]TPL88743.1 hypothetical protein FJ948_21320 [Mesorhizobium sp. B2-3-12]
MTRDRPVISAFDFDVIKNALKAIVVEGAVPESEWDQQARNLVRIFSGTGADETMVRVLLESCRTCIDNASERELPVTHDGGAHFGRQSRNLRRSRELLARGRHERRSIENAVSLALSDENASD